MMKIIGNGVDIVKNSRIKKLISNKKFIQRIYSRSEINLSKKIRNKGAYFAKRFAAKEAFVKSIGTGFRKGTYWRDIGVSNLPTGAPTIILTGGALENLIKIIPQGMSPNINLTMTDDYPIAEAVVIISANK